MTSTQLDEIQREGTERGFNIGALSTKIDAVQEDVKRIELLLNGNGNPRNGLVSTIIRIEEQISNATNLCTENAKTSANLLAAVRELKDSVADHQKSVHLSTLLKSFKFWALFISFMAVLIIVVHDVFVAGDVSASQAIWDFIKGLFL